MAVKNFRQWHAWREDPIGCTRPPVTCQNCDTHYPRGTDEGNAIYEGFNLVECGKCQAERHKREMATAKKRCFLTIARHIAARRKRTIYRDVAVRYLQIFGGQTFSVQTGIDTAEIYLENAKGQIIGSVSYLDKYPKAPVTDFSDIPY